MMRSADIFKIGIALIAIQLACVSTQASWYWPFGSDKDEDEKEPPRLSVLMEPASLLIDDAADCAAAGSNELAIATYRKALTALDKIEADTEKEFPGYTKKPEFATLRNKRAYVTAAIDSMLLGQIKSNARAVAVSDTRELEKKLAAEKEKRSRKEVEVDRGGRVEKVAKEKAKTKGEAKAKKVSLRAQAMRDIAKGDYAAAKLAIDEMLAKKPNSATALNLKAVMEIRQGDLKAAENTLDRCIMNNPRSYFAYYNMCELYLRKGNAAGAKRYYETGRAYGGPKNADLEKALK